jgi:hypothetical protein
MLIPKLSLKECDKHVILVLVIEEIAFGCASYLHLDVSGSNNVVNAEILA